MCRTLTWLVLTLFLSGGWLFSQVSQSGNPPASSNKQTPPDSTETTRQDVGILQALAEATAKSAKEKTWFQGTGNLVLLWDYWTAKTSSEENLAGFALDTSLSQQLFLEDSDPALAVADLVVAGAERAGLLQKTEIEKIEDNAYLNGFVTPGPIPTLNPANGIVIDDIQLVSDSSPPPNGITIDTAIVPNPSNDGMEAKVPPPPAAPARVGKANGWQNRGLDAVWQPSVTAGSPKKPDFSACSACLNACYWATLIPSVSCMNACPCE
jgi:hypothetical protein